MAFEEPDGDNAAPAATRRPFQFRGRFLTVVAMRLEQARPDAEFFSALDEQLHQAPQFFANAPLILDLEQVSGLNERDEMAALVTGLRARRLSVFGVQNASEAQRDAARAAGLIAVPQGRDAPPRGGPGTQPDAGDEAAAPRPGPAATVAEPRPDRETRDAAARRGAPDPLEEDETVRAFRERIREKVRARSARGPLLATTSSNTAAAAAAAAAGSQPPEAPADIAASAPAEPLMAPAPPEPPEPPANLVITTPVRSGQTVFADRGDLVVVGPVSSGAELVAAGNIHIYGRLRGRAMAGVNGDSLGPYLLSQPRCRIAGDRRPLPDQREPGARGPRTAAFRYFSGATVFAWRRYNDFANPDFGQDGVPPTPRTEARPTARPGAGSSSSPRARAAWARPPRPLRSAQGLPSAATRRSSSTSTSACATST